MRFTACCVTPIGAVVSLVPEMPRKGRFTFAAPDWPSQNAGRNVCPEYGKPASPCLYACSYTVPARSKRGSFIIAGGADAVEVGEGPLQVRIIRFGDTSREAMREKVRFTVALMAGRVKALGFEWKDAMHTQAYTVQDIGGVVGDEVFKQGAAPGGLNWTYCRPPVVGLEYEMDVRGAAREIVLTP